jgi:hypothetical protein
MACGTAEELIQIRGETGSRETQPIDIRGGRGREGQRR